MQVIVTLGPRFLTGFRSPRQLEEPLYKPELINIFGEDIVYDLRGLLIAHSGSNLRNLLAHGLIDYEKFSSWGDEVSLVVYIEALCFISTPEDKKLYITSQYTKFE